MFHNFSVEKGQGRIFLHLRSKQQPLLLLLPRTDMEHPQTSTAEAGEAGPTPTQPSIPENERQHTVDTSSETPDRTLDESRQFKRNPISYGENELRRRHVKSVDKDDTNAQSETAASSEPAVNHHSGNAGFYECNIW